MTVNLRMTPTATSYDVEDLVGLVKAGNIRIPDFQRQFRWGIEDARRLFDSIIRGYPLGSLLLWSRPAEESKIIVGALQIDAPRRDNALWVVDGQQRLIVLANALSVEGARDERFALSLDLESQEVVTGPVGANPLRVPLPVVFDLPRLLAWFRDNGDAAGYFDAAADVTKKIRQFRIPASIVESPKEDILRDIFDRMNNYGKRLTRAEVFSALHPVRSEQNQSASRPIDDIAAYLTDSMQFGAIDGDTILMAVLARRGPDITREIRWEFNADRNERSDFPEENVAEAYDGAKAAMHKAIEFLQSKADVPHLAFLPYRYLLPVLTRVFSHHPHLDARQLRLLRRWFWRTAAAPVGSATATARMLCALVVPNDADATLRAMLDVAPQSKVVFPDVQNFRTNYATGKIVACALWALGPRSLSNATVLEHSELVAVLDDDHTPRRALTAIVSRKAAGTEHADSAAKFLLIPGIEVAPAEISTLLENMPSGISPDSWISVLSSHALDAEMIAHLVKGRTLEFVTSREAALTSAIGSFLSARWEFDFEDTPSLDSLVVDDLEIEGRGQSG